MLNAYPSLPREQVGKHQQRQAPDGAMANGK
jgi:hypothetical protein